MSDIRVAAAEDNFEIRESLRVLIDGSSGFECKHVYFNGEEAVKDMPNHQIDVALIDINMPVMDGITCISKLRELMPDTQFMMCTVYDDDESIFNALAAGATGYLMKRTSPAQILEAIRELHNGGSPMSTEIARRVVSTFNKKKEPPVNENLALLTEREKEVLQYLSKGFLYKEIAEKIFVSHETVKKHIHNIYEKLQVQTRTEALNKVFIKNNAGDNSDFKNSLKQIFF